MAKNKKKQNGTVLWFGDVWLKFVVNILPKDRQVYLEGRLQTRSWEDQQGQKKYTTEIVANTVQFLGSNDRSQSQNMSSGGMGTQDFGPEPSFDSSEEIPF